MRWRALSGKGIAHDTVLAADPPEPVLPTGTGRLLFVDDEEALVRLAPERLEGLGHEVAAYTSSLAAFEAFQAEPYGFDLVITDQMMPGMTGAALVENLRRTRPDIPIILYTGFSHLMTAENAQ